MMRAKELRKLQRDILRKLQEGDEYHRPTNPRFEDFILNRISESKSALWGQFTGYMSHEEYVEHRQRLDNFYESITPEEIRLLNMQTHQCLNCGEHLTEDEYYEIEYPPFELLASFSDGYDTYDRKVHPYCKGCIYKVPLQTTSKKHRPGFVYLAETELGHKIGKSLDAQKRMTTLGAEFGKCTLLATIAADDFHRAERHLQMIFWHRHIDREIYALTDDDVAHIIRLGS